jgi:hypothetical protein
VKKSPVFEEWKKKTSPHWFDQVELPETKTCPWLCRKQYMDIYVDESCLQNGSGECVPNVLGYSADLQDAVENIVSGPEKDTVNVANSDPRPFAPVVLIGFGFAAVVIMKAVWKGHFNPMGVVAFGLV